MQKEPSQIPAKSLVIMGVSGSGKSTVGERLAIQLGFSFIDADDLHPESNKSLMSQGIPLSDVERFPWLDKVGATLQQYSSSNKPLVLACSALKRTYRDRLRIYSPDLSFIHLDGAQEEIESRISSRSHEFMPASLLDSQFANLEPLQADERGIRIDIRSTPEEICLEIEKILLINAL